MSNPIAKKFDTDKPPMSLLPNTALREIAMVLLHGKKKYGAHNWRAGMDWSRIADATLRHLYAWIDGEDKDPESGISHLAHCGCNILFLLAYEKLGLGKDDRFKIEETKEISNDTNSITSSVNIRYI